MTLTVLALVSHLVLGQDANYPSFPCFKQHGRFSTQNGTPQAIWLIGTTRRVRVDGELPKALADLEDPYMMMTGDSHSYIFGDFTICPLERDIPGHQRLVKVTAAERLVVQSLYGRFPTFKVLSTWPAGTKQQ